MIVFTRVFLILFVPCLVHGDPTTIGWSLFPAFPGGSPTLPHDVNAPIQFIDFTSYFTGQTTNTNRLLCIVSQGSYYRLPGNIKHLSLADSQIMKKNAIVVTPGVRQGFLILVPQGTMVRISRDPGHHMIRVPVNNDIRVVRVIDIEMMRIWNNCKACFDMGKERIKEYDFSRRPEDRVRYMVRCFHNNLWNVGHDFIWERVRDRVDT